MLELWALENEIYDGGVRSICGVDEAGRGPLAGPVCAAAVVLPRGAIIEGLNDSKKLSEKRREALFNEICDKALEYSIAFASVEEIEKLNILNATFLAMNRAISGLGTAPELALIDGNQTRAPVRSFLSVSALVCPKSEKKNPPICLFADSKSIFPSLKSVSIFEKSFILQRSSSPFCSRPNRACSV